jgi:hypothetical protein
MSWITYTKNHREKLKMQNTVVRDYDQLEAQCEEVKKEVNMGASECGEREIHKKEVCVYIYLLPFYIQT